MAARSCFARHSFALWLARWFIPSSETAMVQTPQQERIRLFPDIIKGAFLGDYANRLGIAGAITQAILFYIPVVGTLCAMRDYFASRRRRDNLSAFLNLL